MARSGIRQVEISACRLVLRDLAERLEAGSGIDAGAIRRRLQDRSAVPLFACVQQWSKRYGGGKASPAAAAGSTRVSECSEVISLAHTH